MEEVAYGLGGFDGFTDIRAMTPHSERGWDAIGRLIGVVASFGLAVVVGRVWELDLVPQSDRSRDAISKLIDVLVPSGLAVVVSRTWVLDPRSAV